jgi:hypothetical protein
MGPAQHCCPRLSLARPARMHSDLPHSTSSLADSLRSLLQLSLSSDELNSPPLPTGSFRCRLMSLAANSPCCRRRRCLYLQTALGAAAAGVSCSEQPLCHCCWCLLRQTAPAATAAGVSCGKQPLLPPLPMFWLLLVQVHTLNLSFDCSAQTGQNRIT